MAKHYIPEGLQAVIPQLVVADGRKLLDFLEKAFGATTLHAMPGPDDKGVMLAAVRIGDITLFVSDASGFAKPTSANLFLYVPDVDATFAKATAAGATAGAPPSDMFWGDRWSTVMDPFGNQWQIATHLEDVPPAEMMERMKKAQR